MDKIGIIINPHAKKNKKAKVNPVDFYSGIGGKYVEVVATQTLDDISKVARDFKKKGISYLGICGGDGRQACVPAGGRG